MFRVQIADFAVTPTPWGCELRAKFNPDVEIVLPVFRRQPLSANDMKLILEDAGFTVVEELGPLDARRFNPNADANEFINAHPEFKAALLQCCRENWPDDWDKPGADIVNSRSLCFIDDGVHFGADVEYDGSGSDFGTSMQIGDYPGFTQEVYDAGVEAGLIWPYNDGDIDTERNF